MGQHLIWILLQSMYMDNGISPQQDLQFIWLEFDKLVRFRRICAAKWVSPFVLTRLTRSNGEKDQSDWSEPSRCLLASPLGRLYVRTSYILWRLTCEVHMPFTAIHLPSDQDANTSFTATVWGLNQWWWPVKALWLRVDPFFHVGSTTATSYVLGSLMTALVWREPLWQCVSMYSSRLKKAWKKGFSFTSAFSTSPLVFLFLFLFLVVNACIAVGMLARPTCLPGVSGEPVSCVLRDPNKFTASGDYCRVYILWWFAKQTHDSTGRWRLAGYQSQPRTLALQHTSATTQ